MTKKQFKTLSEFEDSFVTAKAGYYRALLKSDVIKMSEIYAELGYKIDSVNCNTCILAMLLNLAKEYDNYKTKTTKKDETRN